MTNIEILDAAIEPDRWQHCLDKLPRDLVDIYFSARYGQIYVSDEDQKFVLFHYEEGGNVWTYAFLKNRLPDHLRVPGEGKWFDIESCHGYCGPLATTDDARFLERATSSFDEWCQEEKIVAEFVRLHPFLNNQRWLSKKAEVVADRKTVSLRLPGPEGSGFGISKNGFDMVKKSARSGVAIGCANDAESFSEFFSLYDQTMQRLNADNFYYFDQDQFSLLAALVKQSGWLITATFEGKMLAGAMFLQGGKFLHYHLSATDPNNRIPGTTNAIIHHAAKIGRAHDLQQLHLGGGTTRDESDGLLKFKEKMATDEHLYSFAKRIHHREFYLNLKENWRQFFPELAQTYGSRLLCYRYGRPKAAQSSVSHDGHLATNILEYD